VKLTACGGASPSGGWTEATPTEPSAGGRDTRVLLAYFSGPGESYWKGSRRDLRSAFAISAMSSQLAGARRTPELVAAASAHGYTTAFGWSAALLALGALLSWALIESHRAEPATAPNAATAEPVAVH
jgi:hypothetical protein